MQKCKKCELNLFSWERNVNNADDENDEADHDLDDRAIISSDFFVLYHPYP